MKTESSRKRITRKFAEKKLTQKVCEDITKNSKKTYFAEERRNHGQEIKLIYKLKLKNFEARRRRRKII